MKSESSKSNLDWTNDEKRENNCLPSQLAQIEATDLSFDTVPDSPSLKRKGNEIETLISNNSNPSLEELRDLALSEGGLVCDDLRRKVWPLLLSLDPSKAEPAPELIELKSHPEYQQVVLDVNRSLKRFPPGIPYNRRVALQDQLTVLILRVITKYPHLRYYQGYHDVAVTFLLVVGEDVAFQIMERLSTDHLKDCMGPTMDKTSYLLNFIFPLIQRLHPSLCEFLDRSSVGTMFCLPWFLTWYGHSLNRYRDVVRLYDYFLASPPLLPLYLAATIVNHRQDEVFSVDCDMASVHCLLSHLSDDLPFEKLLRQATELYDQFPPESVESEVKERCKQELYSKMQETHFGDFEKLKLRLNVTCNGITIEVRIDIQELKVSKGIALQDIVTEVHLFLHRVNLPSEVLTELLVKMADIEYRLTAGTPENLQLSALVGAFHLARTRIDMTQVAA